MPELEDTILWQDERYFAIAKPHGRICEGATRDDLPPSLEASLRSAGKGAYAAHRLDVDTTGVLLFARNKAALLRIQEAFATKRIRKSYLAVVDGEWPKALNKCEGPILKQTDAVGFEVNDLGKPSRTTFRVLESTPEKSLIEALPKTGRTHQIRVHCKFLGHAILGDRLYGSATTLDEAGDPVPQALHAHKIQFRHPFTGLDIKVTCPLPPYWKTHWLKNLKTQEL